MRAIEAWKSWTWDKRIAALAVAVTLTFWCSVVAAGILIGLVASTDTAALVMVFVGWLIIFMMASMILAMAFELFTAVNICAEQEQEGRLTTSRQVCVLKTAYRLATSTVKESKLQQTS